MIDVIETDAAFEALRDEWQALERNSALRVFQTFVWNRNAWRATDGGSLFILRWHQDGRADTVIFPFWLDRRGNLRFIGDGFGDVFDCVYGADAANRHWAYKEAADALVADRRVRNVWLQKLGDTSEALRYFGVFLRGAIVFRDHVRGQVVTDRTDDFVGDLAGLRHRDRSRMHKVAAEFPGLVLRIERDRFPRAEVEALRSFMVGKGWRAAGWLEPRLVDLAEAAFAAGRCEVAMLEDAEGVQSLGFRLVKDGQADAWVCLYRDRRMTSALDVRYMQEKAKTGAWTFDLGVGDYNYKRQVFRPQPKVSFTLRSSKGVAGTVWNFIRANVRMFRMTRG